VTKEKREKAAVPTFILYLQKKGKGKREISNTFPSPRNRKKIPARGKGESLSFNSLSPEKIKEKGKRRGAGKEYLNSHVFDACS